MACVWLESLLEIDERLILWEWRCGFFVLELGGVVADRLVDWSYTFVLGGEVWCELLHVHAQTNLSEPCFAFMMVRVYLH